MTRQNQKNSGSTDGTGGRGKAGRESRGNGAQEKGAPEVYAALDLGTNNCRLLIARPGNVRDANGRSFRVINTYSRIVRLGEGLDDAQVLSAAAMDRTIDALKVCAERLARFGVTRSRCVTTAACRKAANGSEFLGRIFDETGIKLEIISGEDEARLAIDGCAPLLDPRYSRGLVLDIGGGSTELVWVEIDGAELRVTGCASLPFGVVTFAEKYGGDRVPEDVYDRMVADAASALAPFEAAHGVRAQVDRGAVQMLGTSGTVTTLVACHKGLKRYDRRQVDGAWIGRHEIAALSRKLAAMTCDQRSANPCIGPGRADLVVAGCAILEGINRTWPCPRLRVADRGLREGVINQLMNGAAA